jgi:uncharacterized SAM-binding protein YcdF (DUF218 family)
MKFIGTIISVLVVIALIAWGLSSYLVIDDLKDCSAPDPTSQTCKSADVIIAISGGDTQARTQEAIDLYKAGWAPQLLFSGAALDTSGPSNAQAMRSQAIKAGVPPSAIILDNTATDTTQNAQGTDTLLSSTDTRIILVTSPYHQRRASIEFKKALGDRITIVNHPAQDDENWSSHWWTNPYSWWLAIGEFFKSLVVSSWR